MGKRKIASAIGYSPEDPAPALLASGRGREAEYIIAVAEQAGVTVMEDAALATLLDSWAGNPRVKPGDFIPPWCWEAVAKILVFVTKAH
ncbi:MAG: EscU/YscU/HrcU family type III secretion system export apparatus switch protein [Treponema sp.]|jgi:flagellar biosynthesis protein|nr:EscU/YscU/HrcU family type III secretion system export apparatus switch protein [Treponema sp.]